MNAGKKRKKSKENPIRKTPNLRSNPDIPNSKLHLFKIPETTFDIQRQHLVAAIQAAEDQGQALTTAARPVPEPNPKAATRPPTTHHSSMTGPRPNPTAAGRTKRKSK